MITNTDIYTTGGLTEATVPKEVMSLAHDLAKIHGPINIANEASGFHIYIADPDLLKKDGKVELSKKHLAINAEKYIACHPTKYPNYAGRYSVRANPCKETRDIFAKFGKYNREMPCATSMKTKVNWRVDTLLAMLPITKRGKAYADVKPHVFQSAIRKGLVLDEHGQMVPDWVGHTIPLTQLPEDHPCIQYVVKRGYDPAKLEEQFEACYCDKAKPVDRAAGRFYSKLPGGLHNTPQGRLILSIRMNGSRKGYQSRLIDKTEGGTYYVWTENETWEAISSLQPDGTLWRRFEPTDEFPKGFDPHKYLNAVGSHRNELLMGYDAAVAFNADRPKSKRFCILCEGPLDAAKLQAPAIAILGKSLSVLQAKALTEQFGVICTCMDQDAAGRQCLQRINTMIPNRIGKDVRVPDGHKDAGELSYEEAAVLAAQCDPMT